MVNGTPVSWTSRKIPTVETSTFGTELISHRTCADEVAALRYELRMLGAPIDGPAWVFGDNKSEIDSTSNPAGRLKKRHLLLAFHRVRQLSASIFTCHHIPSGVNLADVLTKACDHDTLWKLIRPVLFWKGDVSDCGTTTVAANGAYFKVLAPTGYAPGCGEYQACNAVQPVAVVPTQSHFPVHRAVFK